MTPEGSGAGDGNSVLLPAFRPSGTADWGRPSDADPRTSGQPPQGPAGVRSRARQPAEIGRPRCTRRDAANTGHRRRFRKNIAVPQVRRSRSGSSCVALTREVAHRCSEGQAARRRT